jgi:cellulose synthase/poly-beta-1,6-N-acetylglucosamine synthase-like glycosyltransferase
MLIRARPLVAERARIAMGSDGRAYEPGPDLAAAAGAILAPVRALQQHAGVDQYGFLAASVIDRSDLARAGTEAARSGVALHEALLAMGWLSASDYASALARSLGLPLAGWDAVLHAKPAARNGSRDSTSLRAYIGGRVYQVLCADAQAPDAVRRQAAALEARGLPVALAARQRIDAALEEQWRQQRMDRAVLGLRRRRPMDSAGGATAWTWQRVATAVTAGLVVGGLGMAPETTVAVVAGLAAMPFLCVSLLRLAALREVAAASRSRRVRNPPATPIVSDDQLPVYSVLVPLYREAGVLPGLVQALDALDYPRAKLDILLVLEAADLDTQAAVTALRLPPQFRTVLVPEGQPRTKPKALNYALQLARGGHVVVYDAEDRPEPDQLRRALDAFRRGPPGLGCMQAQLNIYNPLASWFTRQFTVEYSALFDAILPALARLGLPVPLGGSSNHFPRRALIAAGGWDPFNVTEDADLGFRMARQGWHTGVLASTTWEEAPATFGSWFRQRTRWLKGWMQTYLVHTRQPWRLATELGLRGALGFHALMGGLVLSALVHPLLYALIAWHALTGRLLAPADTAASAALWAIAWINLAAGYLVSILVGALSAWRRGQPRLALSALLMPLCWLLVSAAAYRALYQLATDPYGWEKTEHGGRYGAPGASPSSG